MDIKDFDKLLLETSNHVEMLDFIRKHFFHGTPYVFQGREDAYFDFRNRIATHFKVAVHEVFIVGSAKFGFSYWQGTEFSYESDIDVAIVNNDLFESFYDRICDYQYVLDRMHKSISTDEKKLYSEFLRYMIKGWMRPDKLPVSFQVNLLKQEWFDFFKSISHGATEVGNYEVNAGLYKNHHYLEKYYLKQMQRHFKILEMRNA